MKPMPAMTHKNHPRTIAFVKPNFNMVGNVMSGTVENVFAA